MIITSYNFFVLLSTGLTAPLRSSFRRTAAHNREEGNRSRPSPGTLDCRRQSSWTKVTKSGSDLS